MKIRILILGIIILLLKSNTNAQEVNFEWAKQIGGTDSEVASDIAIDSKGNIYITGSFSDTVDFDPGVGVFNLYGPNEYGNIFIAKYNSSGQLLWAEYFGNGGGSALVVDASDNIIISGTFREIVDFDPGIAIYNLAANPAGIFILKMTNNGNFIWAKQLGVGGQTSIAIDNKGNILTTGQFQGKGDFDPGVGIFYLSSVGQDDIFISKLDSSGEFIWAKQFGGNNYDVVNSIAIDSLGNMYVVGDFRDVVDFDPGSGVVNFTATVYADSYILKLSDLGDFIWAKQIKSTICSGVAVSEVGNICITGRFLESVDFDFGVSTFKLASKGVDDIFILKLDSSGSFIWVKQIGGISNDGSAAIAIDNYGNIYTIGYFFQTADFDPGIDTYNLICSGNNNVFISKLDSSGRFMWAKQIDGGWTKTINSIAIGKGGEVYTTGQIHLGTADFDPGMDTFNLTSKGGYDIFVHKMNQLVLGVDEEIIINPINPFPNPTPGIITIDIPFKNEQEKINVAIYTVEGILLKEYSVNSQPKLHLDLGDQPTGVYMVKLSSGMESIVFKVSIIR